MLREKILELFHDCDPVVQKIIADVITLEWEKLSYTRPHVKDDVRQIIEDAVKEVKE